MVVLCLVFDSPSYSNAGFSVLGRVLESPAGQAYEEFVEKNVYAPLGMTSSAFTVRHDTHKSCVSMEG